MADFSNIPTGLKITSQIPLDTKTYSPSESILSYLGPSDSLAFTYYDGLRVYCVAQKTIYEWKEKTTQPANSGLISTGDFTYPSNTIIFGIDYSGKKYNFYKIDYVSVSDNKTYDAASLGTGETIYKDKTVVGNNTTFNFKEISTTNIGTGIPVLGNISTSGDNVVISGKTLKTNNLSITESAGEITIDTPTDPSDIKFYVNENYTGGNSNGSLSKPYTNLKDAFTAFIGNGSIIAPQYNGIGTIELLSNVTVLSTGTKAMTYVSVNNLKMKGNGYKLIYAGTQEYFISTEYLVGLCPKTTNQKLDYNIFMSFKDLTIESQTQHKIINNLNYTSPTTSGFQNASGIKFENCEIIDQAYTKETADYINTGVNLFGEPVFAQNTLPKSQFTIKNKDVNWNGEGGFQMLNCKIIGSSSTLIYNLNSSLSISDITMDFNPYYVCYKDTTGSVYNPIEGVHYVLNENNGLSGKSFSYFRIENFKQGTQKASSGGSYLGGVDSVVRVVGNGYVNIYNGSFYSEKTNNLVQLQNTNSDAALNNLNATFLTTADATYGALKYTGSIPGSAKAVNVNMSTINNVKNWTTLQYIIPSADSATINNAYFTDKASYPNDTAAKAAGLIPGNVYYNTTGQIATRVA